MNEVLMLDKGAEALKAKIDRALECLRKPPRPDQRETFRDIAVHQSGVILAAIKILEGRKS